MGLPGIVVAPGAFPNGCNHKLCQYTKAGELRYYASLSVRERDFGLTLAGLIIALIGVATSFAIGKIVTVIELGKPAQIAWAITGAALTATGLVLAFLKSALSP